MRTTIVECDRCGQENPLYITELKLHNGMVFHDVKVAEKFMRVSVDVCGQCAGEMLYQLTATMEWGRTYSLLRAIREYRATLVEPKE
jgi:hypothetical protein